MCVETCIEFARRALSADEVRGKRVLEVGAYDVNGSVRSIVAALGPAAYVGVDIADGPGVDELCDVGGLVARFGLASFDLVITTEMMEHVRDWRSAIRNLEGVLRPGGVLVITTRSRGFKYHGYPFDFWRYELADMSAICRDLDIELLETDPATPGVFVKARRPKQEQRPAPDLASIELFSIILGRRAGAVTEEEVADYLRTTRTRRAAREVLQRVVPRILPQPVKDVIKRVVPRSIWQ